MTYRFSVLQDKKLLPIAKRLLQRLEVLSSLAEACPSPLRVLLVITYCRRGQYALNQVNSRNLEFSCYACPELRSFDQTSALRRPWQGRSVT